VSSGFSLEYCGLREARRRAFRFPRTVIAGCVVLIAKESLSPLIREQLPLSFSL
jgi:hypothetical protein